MEGCGAGLSSGSRTQASQRYQPVRCRAARARLGARADARCSPGRLLRCAPSQVKVLRQGLHSNVILARDLSSGELVAFKQIARRQVGPLPPRRVAPMRYRCSARLAARTGPRPALSPSHRLPLAAPRRPTRGGRRAGRPAAAPPAPARPARGVPRQGAWAWAGGAPSLFYLFSRPSPIKSCCSWGQDAAQNCHGGRGCRHCALLAHPSSEPVPVARRLLPPQVGLTNEFLVLVMGQGASSSLADWLAGAGAALAGPGSPGGEAIARWLMAQVFFALDYAHSLVRAAG